MRDFMLIIALCFGAMPISSSHAVSQDKRSGSKPEEKAETVLWDGKTLAGWEATKFGGEGEVKIENGAILFSSGSDMTGVNYTKRGLPTMDYELVLEAKRIGGNDFFGTTTFPVGKDFCSLVVGGWGGTTVGLSSIDGQDASENATTTLKTFKKDTWYRIRIRVTKTKIQCWIDDEQVIDQTTKEKMLSIRPECEPCKPLGIASWRTTAAIRGIKIIRLQEGK